jgi:O-acetyl-ADP-ribose deacetylase (regulator of RNase III)
MIRYTTGDILKAETQAIVNTVNCVGVMGRGLALQFKRAFPANFKAYAAACKRHEVVPGRMFVHESGELTGPRFIINFPTKRHWRGKSRLDDISTGLAALARELEQRQIRSVAIPPLGSGLGGLAWADVRSLIDDTLSALTDIEVVVYEPSQVASSIAIRSRSIPKMTPGRAALVGLMDRYLSGLMDVSITLLEVHKLMYFMQVAGEELRLKYVRAHYGPYAENLRHVLHAIEGHLVSGYADGGDAPEKPLELVPGAVADARAFLREQAETQKRFDRVAELVDGFETPFGLELLATTHMVLVDAPHLDDDGLRDEVYAWSPRKRQYTPGQLELARERLNILGWLPKF